MKPEVRFLGVDDGAFAFGDATVPVVGVVTRGAAYVEHVVRTDVTVDGTDATARLVALLDGAPFTRGLKAVLVDGVAFGGFNVLDVRTLFEATGVPVVTVASGAPDFAAMQAALEKHHADWRERWRLIEAARGTLVATEGKSIMVGATGLAFEDAVALVAATTVRGLVPEPVRLAHLIASGVFKRA